MIPSARFEPRCFVENLTASCAELLESSKKLDAIKISYFFSYPAENKSFSDILSKVRNFHGFHQISINLSITKDDFSKLVPSLESIVLRNSFSLFDSLTRKTAFTALKVFYELISDNKVEILKEFSHPTTFNYGALWSALISSKVSLKAGQSLHLRTLELEESGIHHRFLYPIVMNRTEVDLEQLYFVRERIESELIKYKGAALHEEEKVLVDYIQAHIEGRFANGLCFGYSRMFGLFCLEFMQRNGHLPPLDELVDAFLISKEYELVGSAHFQKGIIEDYVSIGEEGMLVPSARRDACLERSYAVREEFLENYYPRYNLVSPYLWTMRDLSKQSDALYNNSIAILKEMGLLEKKENTHQEYEAEVEILFSMMEDAPPVCASEEFLAKRALILDNLTKRKVILKGMLAYEKSLNLSTQERCYEKISSFQSCANPTLLNLSLGYDSEDAVLDKSHSVALLISNLNKTYLYFDSEAGVISFHTLSDLAAFVSASTFNFYNHVRITECIEAD